MKMDKYRIYCTNFDLTNKAMKRRSENMFCHVRWEEQRTKPECETLWLC